MANKDLNKAKAANKDGFYTRLEDIENELNIGNTSRARRFFVIATIQDAPTSFATSP